MGSVLLEKHLQLICTSTQLKPKQVRAVLQLLEEGATIPFIARYRKEATGSLDEVQIAEVQRESKKWNDLEARKETILKSIQEQGKLTPTLEQRIKHNYDPTSLEDLYLPYKRKRKTRADKAREKGLEPLAQKVFSQSSGTDPFLEAGSFVNEDVSDAEAALQGARDIIAEWINEDEQNRNTVRRQFRRGATIRSKVARGKQEEGAKYRDYFDFEEPLKNCPSHRLLAIRRGEEEGILRVVIQPEEEETIYQVEKNVITSHHPASKQVRIALEDAYKRLLSPSIETEFRGSSKARADEEAISVFAENLRQLLLAPPLGQKRTLGIDPGFRTGCKVVVLDASGQLLDHTTIFPHPPQKEERNAKKTIEHLMAQYQLEA
ncbi:MAG: RNA-binding transcriptional accessory protein, partial [Saprospiraceae bacterium]|nr:RNA-binding transcriptional accessory protein [Saprospiraceae bacterium]